LGKEVHQQVTKVLIGARKENDGKGENRMMKVYLREI